MAKGTETLHEVLRACFNTNNALLVLAILSSILLLKFPFLFIISPKYLYV